MTVAAAIDMTDRKKAFYAEVRRLANAQFESPQYRRMLALPLNKARAGKYALQKGFWQLNRRDCWAFAQALSPMDVKALIWEHELDELSGNPDRGVENHYDLQVRQAATVGLTREDFERETIADETLTCLYAWLHLSRSGPWLKSFAASAALEVSNSSEWVDGGGISYRWGKKQERELGIPFDKQVNAKEHAEVDVAHSGILTQVVERHCDTPEKLDLVFAGLNESWAIDRTWKGVLTDLMAAVPGPS
jgi:hypothetical protein